MVMSFEPHDDAATRADCVIAATLCLMSCFVQHRQPLYAERITRNLQLLAESLHLTSEMRTLCARLAQRWNRIEADAERAIGTFAGDAHAVH